MATMDEREFFSRRFEGKDPQSVWVALKRALATQDLRDADDERRVARFGTSMGVWSWGQNLLAEVDGDGASATLTVRGRPKSRFLTTNFGESREARKLESELVADIESALEEQLAP